MSLVIRILTVVKLLLGLIKINKELFTSSGPSRDKSFIKCSQPFLTDYFYATINHIVIIPLFELIHQSSSYKIEGADC